MRRPAAGLLLVAAAALLAATALSRGPLATFASSPVCLLLLAQGLALRRGLTPEAPRRLVGSGVALTLLGMFLTGGGASGLAVIAAGVAVLFCASQLALAFDPPPEGLSVPTPSSPLLNAGIAADESIKLFGELTHLIHRRPDYARVAADVRTAADRNLEHGWVDHPERAHPKPPPLEKFRLSRRSVRGAGSAEHISYLSEFEPQDPEIRDAYLGLRRNQTAHAYLWRSGGEPRPVLICVHGYGMGQVALDVHAWDVRWLHGELGYDLALTVLPLHGPRAAARWSGGGFLDGHPLWTSAAIAQAVWELRRLAGWLRAEGAPTIGVFGLSLGGYASALFASIEDGIGCAIPAVAPASLDEIFWRHLPPLRRDQAHAAGLTGHLLSTAWARHAPLRVRPRVPHEARLVIGGLADRIVPPHQVAALWEHWGRPNAHWFPGTHLAWIGRRALRARVAAHLRATLGTAAG